MFGVLRSMSDGLAKTRKNLADKIGSLVLGEKIDEAFLDELEEALIAADVGVSTASFVLKESQTLQAPGVVLTSAGA